MPIRPDVRPLYEKRAWKLLSWHLRHRRAGSRCECTGECGDHHIGNRCEERDGQKDAWSFSGPVRLAVAHLDHDPRHNSANNLRVLCQRCHLKHDAPHHARQRAKGRRERLAKIQYRLELVLPLPSPTSSPKSSPDQ